MRLVAQEELGDGVVRRRSFVVAKIGQVAWATAEGRVWPAAGGDGGRRGHRPQVGARADASPNDGTIRAPMAGRLVDVRAAAGAQVAAGEVLATLEAMKMEHGITAPCAGRVVAVEAAAGAQLAAGQVVVRLA